MKKVFVRSPFNYDVDAASEEAGFSSELPSKAHQSFKDECDINGIVRRFGLTGKMPDNFRAPEYGDFSQVSDYQSALNAVIEAEKAFAAMPAGIRARFHNNPQNLLEFVAKAENRDEAEKLGLVNKITAKPVSGDGVSVPAVPAVSEASPSPAKV